MSDTEHSYFAAAARGIAPLLADELTALGASQVRRAGAGVSFAGPLETGYAVCLWSRLASRVLLTLARVEAGTADALYAGVRDLPWAEHMAPDGTLAVRFNGTSPEIRNSHFGALRVKDAIVDHFRDGAGTRPSVDLESPDLRVDVHLHKDLAVVSVDLSGGGLHRRGYRVDTVEAPLKENVAAALLVHGGWPEIAADGGGLVDPMCGSGTLLIEAAWIAGDRAPALGRRDLGLEKWQGHDAALWQRLCAAAAERAAAGGGRVPPIRGFDTSVQAVRAALANAERAGVADAVHVERRALAANVGPAGARPGLVATNPPYGQRLSEESGVRARYVELATQLRRHYGGWRAAVLSTTPEWAPTLGLRCLPEILTNGPLECRILAGRVPRNDVSRNDVPGHDEASSGGGADEAARRRPARAPRPSVPPARAPLSEGAQMFANRLRKNLRILGKWARRQQVHCYRLYDADMPEYAVAVDLYHCADGLRAHVQEYRAPATVDAAAAASRLQEALTTIPEVLEMPPERLFFKVRERKRGTAQYRRLGDTGIFHEVQEGDCTFLVNFTDYLDTGLFLDHRPTRALLAEWAAGQRFLNLFGYTGTATAHAARGGALSTTTVDMSRPYLDWARRNLERNGFGGRVHELVQADCLQWLADDGRRRADRYGLVFLDPPTFSNSKRMQEESFEVQRDHAGLILQAARLLADDGVLVFSTNFRQFRLDEGALAGLRCEDISRKTLPKDFERNPRIHQCYRIQRA